MNNKQEKTIVECIETSEIHLSNISEALNKIAITLNEMNNK